VARRKKRKRRKGRNNPTAQERSAEKNNGSIEPLFFLILSTNILDAWLVAISIAGQAIRKSVVAEIFYDQCSLSDGISL
jgi:hypothetical protein